jgi:transposase-like protein
MNVFEPRYQNADAAREHLEALMWPDGPFCPHCGSVKATRLPPQRKRKTKAHPDGAIRNGVVQCNDCRQQYTVTVGTVFESSKVGLHKWLYVTHVLCSSKKGTSAHQIARNIGVTYKTAWFMMHRIREAMKDTHSGPMGGHGETIEADETYGGGKTKNRNAKQQKRFEGQRRGPLQGKQAVVVIHSKGEYGRAGVFHTNTIEGFFSLLKRGTIGTYHHVSEQHLSRYTSEFDFRYNTRKLDDFERADESLLGAIGKRLTYRRIDAVAT